MPRLFSPLRRVFFFFVNIFINVIITTHSSPLPAATNSMGNQTINSTLPVHISTGVFSTEVKMNFYDSSVPLVYEMAIPDLQALQHHSTIPPNPKLPSIVTLNAILDETHRMLDHMMPIYNSEQRRAKRSIEYIADFYSWCCGQAKQSDVDQLYVHEKSLDGFTSAIKSQMNRDHSFLVQQYQIENDFQNKVERALNFTAMSVSNVSNLLVRNEHGMESQIQSEAMGIIQVAVTMHAVTSTSAWIKTLSDCRNKFIPVSVIIPHILSKDLKRLNSSLSSRSRTLAIPPEAISIYLTQPLATCLISVNKIVVTIKVPTRQTGTVHKLIRMHPLPFAFDNNVCQINLETNYALQVNGDIIPLSQFQLPQCDPTHSSLCHVSRYERHTFHSATCISSALSEFTLYSSIQQSCSLTCSHSRWPPTKVQQVDGHTFIIVHPVLPIKVDCHGKESQNFTYRQEMGHLKLVLPCRCTATIPSSPSQPIITITPDFPCAINSPFLMTFHHQILPAFVAVDDHIIGEDSTFENLDRIINRN
jgi:hypothetical protein